MVANGRQAMYSYQVTYEMRAGGTNITWGRLLSTGACIANATKPGDNATAATKLQVMMHASIEDLRGEARSGPSWYIRYCLS